MPQEPADWMRLAIEQAAKAIETGQTPFGAVVVRDNQLVAAGHNEVWQRTDPTAHAEVVALQRAAKELARIDLAGCEMYTTCEPCPMCAAAIHWSNLDRVYYGATIADADQAGFRELRMPIETLYEQGGSKVKVLDGLLTPECAALFQQWMQRGESGTY